MMWFGQTGLKVNRFETGLSTSVNGALVSNYLDHKPTERRFPLGFLFTSFVWWLVYMYISCMHPHTITK